MSSLAIRLLPEQLRLLAFSSISATYSGIGTAIANPARLILLINDTDVLLFFSIDGINDYWVLPSGSQIIIDITANHSSMAGVLSIAQGTRIYVKGLPSSGAVYFTSWYGSNS
jgi:hypothetical protein